MNKALRQIKAAWTGCKDCTIRDNPGVHEYVFFRGSCPCDVLFIGEAPGKDEDLYGEPFIGRAGRVLDSMIQQAGDELCDRWNSSKSTLFYHNTAGDAFSYGITNIVACMPLLNSSIRPPTKEEAEACNPRLIETIRACQPKLMVLLGQVAKKHHKIPVGLESIPTVELQHPAYILRNGGVGCYQFDSNVLQLVEAIEQFVFPAKEKTVPRHTKTNAKTQKPRKPKQGCKDQKYPKGGKPTRGR